MSSKLSIPQKIRKRIHKALLLCIGSANHVVPKRPLLVLSAFPDVDDQIVALLRHLIRTGARVAVIILVRDAPARAIHVLGKLVGPLPSFVAVVRKASMRGVWAYWRASVVMYTHGIYGSLSVPRRQTSINLWHGMPIKRIWKNGSDPCIPTFTYLLSTCELYRAILAKAAGVCVDRVLPIGLPRNDLLFSESDASKQFRSAVSDGVQRVGMFLPTYRKPKAHLQVGVYGIESESVLGMDHAEARKLRAFLAAAQVRLLVKPHPMSIHYGKNAFEDEFLWIINDEWLYEQGVGLYEALGRIDFLITDLSSVYIDYLALQKPIIFYFPDMQVYKGTQAFMLEPMEDWLAGPLCLSVAELLFRLDELVCKRRDDYMNRRARLAAVLNPQHSAGATRALFELMRSQQQGFNGSVSTANE